MTGQFRPLAGLARRIAGPRSALPLRGGGGGPVKFALPPTRPLAEQDELMWDDGSSTPEPCLDQFDLVTKWQALGYLSGGMLFFVGLYQGVKLLDKPSKVPFAPREYPYANGLPEEWASLVSAPRAKTGLPVP